MRIADKVIYVMRWFNSVVFALLAALLLVVGNVVASAAYAMTQTEISDYVLLCVIAAVLLYILASLAVLAIKPMLKEMYLPPAFASVSSAVVGIFTMCLHTPAKAASSLSVLLPEKYGNIVSEMLEGITKGFTVTGGVFFALAVLCGALFVLLYVKERRQARLQRMY